MGDRWQGLGGNRPGLQIAFCQNSLALHANTAHLQHGIFEAVWRAVPGDFESCGTLLKTGKHSQWSMEAL